MVRFVGGDSGPEGGEVRTRDYGVWSVGIPLRRECVMTYLWEEWITEVVGRDTVGNTPTN